jgi:hypothetical protein
MTRPLYDYRHRPSSTKIKTKWRGCIRSREDGSIVWQCPHRHAKRDGAQTCATQEYHHGIHKKALRRYLFGVDIVGFDMPLEEKREALLTVRSMGMPLSRAERVLIN